MRCAACRHENRTGAKFCEQCGSSLAGQCAQCGAELPAQARFCSECGNPVGASPSGLQPSSSSGALSRPVPHAGDRRQTAVLFADISGYTRLCAEMDAEQVQALLARFYGVVDSIIIAYGGHVLDHAGDAVTGVFGAPRAHGNDIERAVRAGLEMHRAALQLADHAGRPLRLHIGIASGEVVAATIQTGAEPKYSVTGDAVNLAARLDALSAAGETLVTETVYRAVSHLVDADSAGDLVVKGFAAPIAAWRLHALKSTASEPRSFVGRQAELRQLSEAIETVREARSGVAIYLRGEAGIGKSRLVEELRARAERRGYACHIGHVLDFGVARGQSAVPSVLRSVLRVGSAGDEAAVRTALLAALARGLVTPGEEPFIADQLDLEQGAESRSLFDAMDMPTRTRRAAEAVSALLQRSALHQPQLLVIEDIHWASPDLLRLLSQLAIAVTAAPAVLVMTSRIEGDPLDRLWRAATHGSPLMTIDIGPLRPDEARMLAAEVIEASSQSAMHCVDRAEGNPLFLVQLLRNARESRASEVPASIQSLVLARMDRMSPRDKQALQAASVIGKRFSLPAVRALAGDGQYECDALLAGDLVRPQNGDYVFAHALIQEGVYASLLNTRKRELHLQAASWFGAAELVLRAEHLDRAGHADAAAAYVTAAQDLVQRHRYEPAARLLERAAQLPAAGSVKCAAALLIGEVLREQARTEESLAAFKQALELADDDVQRCHAWIGIAYAYRIRSEVELALEAVDRAEAIAAPRQLALECSRLLHMRGNLFFAQGKAEACRQEHEAALLYAQQAESAECEAQALSGLGDAQYALGRMLTALEYFRRCVELCEREGLLRLEIPNRAMVGHCLCYANELDSAIGQLQRAAHAASSSCLTQNEIFVQESLGMIAVASGQLDLAEPALVRSLELARSAGSRRYAHTDLYLLGLVRIAQGRGDEAGAFLTEALALARETGMGFMGPAILGAVALAAKNREERESALGEGEALLRGTCVSHCHLFFYRDAIDATLRAGDWSEALRYGSALETFVQPEPLPWARLIVARCRLLAAFGSDGPHDRIVRELQQLREHVSSVNLGSALPGIDAALASCAA
ncbi:MAG: adenylate/guanylate cyclase domain-containing protein [Proteobacteria bacterium]|nr:MAG: adenylate/guanylate cyclase domain-containing protein [Pseudomonadota bacterium]